MAKIRTQSEFSNLQITRQFQSWPTLQRRFNQDYKLYRILFKGALLEISPMRKYKLQMQASMQQVQVRIDIQFCFLTITDFPSVMDSRYELR